MVRWKFVARGVGVAALQLVLVGEADGVDQEVHRAPLLLDLGEHRIDRGDVLDVAGQDDLAADRFGERLDPPAERLALIGEGKLGAVRGQRLGDAPGDRMIVGDAHHQAALALHQFGHQVPKLSAVMPGHPGPAFGRPVPGFHALAKKTRRGWPGQARP